MAKKNTAPAAAPPGWEVEPETPRPPLPEGYTWCPECHGAFEGEVCPGCSPGIAAVCPCTTAEPGATIPITEDGKCLNCGRVIMAETTFPETELDKTTLTVDGGEPKTLEDLQMELNVKTRNTTESLKCILTDDEIRRYGIAQARANAEIATAEEELQSVKSQYKSRVDAATANRNDMAKRINNGYEFRQVECVERWDYTSNVIRVSRMDTFEVVSRRTMTRDEMQRKLF